MRSGACPQTTISRCLDEVVVYGRRGRGREHRKRLRGSDVVDSCCEVVGRSVSTNRAVPPTLEEVRPRLLSVCTVDCRTRHEDESDFPRHSVVPLVGVSGWPTQTVQASTGCRPSRAVPSGFPPFPSSTTTFPPKINSRYLAKGTCAI